MKAAFRIPAAKHIFRQIDALSYVSATCRCSFVIWSSRSFSSIARCCKFKSVAMVPATGMNPAEVKIVQQPGDCILYGAPGVDRGQSIAIGHRSMAVGLPIRASSEPCFDGREKAQSARQSALNDVRMPTTSLQAKRDVGFVLQNAALRH